MRISRVLGAGAFIAPIVILLILIKFRERERPKFILEASKLKEMQTAWGKHKFTPISLDESFFDRLRAIPIVDTAQNLSRTNSALLFDSVSNIIVANFGRDFDAFQRFRMPSSNNYSISDQMKTNVVEDFREDFPNTAPPSSYLDMARQVWNHDYSKRPYWNAICLDDAAVTVVRTNRLLMPEMISKQPDQPVNCVGHSRTEGLVSYREAAEHILAEQGEVLLASVMILADAIDPPNSPRPFFYLFVWDRENVTWLPVRVTESATKNIQLGAPF